MAVPSLEEHLETYVDALDPEAGNEADYHAASDKAYCWRSSRLLGRQHLNFFPSIRRSDGDFERMVQAVEQSTSTAWQHLCRTVALRKAGIH